MIEIWVLCGAESHMDEYEMLNGVFKCLVLPTLTGRFLGWIPQVLRCKQYVIKCQCQLRFEMEPKIYFYILHFFTTKYKQSKIGIEHKPS